MPSFPEVQQNIGGKGKKIGAGLEQFTLIDLIHTNQREPLKNCDVGKVT